MKSNWLSTITTTLAAVALLATANQGNAAILVSYDTAGLTGSEPSVAAGTTATGLTSDALARGAGLSASAGANSFNSAGWTGEATDFLSMGFDLNPGYTATLTGFQFGTRSSGTGPGTVGVYASADGGSEVLLTTLIQSGTAFLDTDFVLGTPLTVTSDLTIRLRQIGTTSANGGTTGSAGTFRIADYSPDGGTTFADVTLFGFAVVPEPATYWGSLTALAACGYGLLARRRRNC